VELSYVELGVLTTRSAKIGLFVEFVCLGYYAFVVVAGSLNNLAGLYESQGRNSEAEPFYIQALEMRKGLLGEEHPDVAASLNNLARVYESQGRNSEAEPLYIQALEIIERSLELILPRLEGMGFLKTKPSPQYPKYSIELAGSQAHRIHPYGYDVVSF
jgi:tetratricopeptide (TPR) repeat protein